ncbi:MAG: S-layer homology domain-containing protein [Anaerolineales bacterium]|nr:S-layer homology domain-containing protein [Anaerolineales bacterium]
MKKAFLALLLVLVLMGNSIPAGAAPQAAGSASLPILFGSYASADLQTAIGEITSMHNWLTSNGSSGVTFAGDFMSVTLNPFWNVPHEMDAAWGNGFVPFVNLMASESWEGAYYDADCVTATSVAAGNCDDKIALWAGYFKDWAGTDKFAYLAPFPEMNGPWISYHSDGDTYQKAFKRFVTVFENAGVPDSAVEWVFAPNGHHDPGYPYREFENYYPGDQYVDIVAFSAYNYGGCPDPAYNWDTFELAMEPYLIRMQNMAPSKPIFISQTGVLDVPLNPADPNQTKSYWVQDTFSKLADYPGVRAVLYFNKINTYEVVGNCAPPDYRIYYGNNSGEAGFLTIMDDIRFGRWSNRDANWASIAFNDPIYTFADVQPTHPFSGASNIWYYDYVVKLYNNGITGGCETTPDLLYCPNNTVTRAQMAIFLEKGIHTSAFSPADVPATFNDTVGHWAEDWIEALKSDGVTGGCGNNNYCPEDSVTRAQMAVFLLKAKYGGGYTPPNVGISTGFADVATDYWAAAWIKQLAAEAITGGCGGGNYCPETPVTRAQMAVFLVKTFGLP